MTNEFFKHLYTAEGTERMEDVRSVDSSSSDPGPKGQYIESERRAFVNSIL